MSNNPFSPKHPASPEYFINRGQIIDTFIKVVIRSARTKPRKPDNMAILGNWGIGKTSVLRKFEHLALYNLKEDVNAFTAFIELTPSSTIGFNQFAMRVRDEVERSFKVSNISTLAKLKKELMPNWRLKTIDLGIGTIEIDKRGEQSIVTSFEDSLRELWDILEGNGIDVAILMLDDIHYLAQNFPNGLYDIRGIFQRLPMDGCNYMLIITGYSFLFERAKEFAEPFTRFFDRYTLYSFNKIETKNALLKPIGKSGLKISLDEAVIDKIYHLTQGHPYFIHFIMQDLVDLREKGNIDIEFFDRNYINIAKHLAREKFENDLTSLSEAEQRIVLDLVDLPDIVTPSDIKIKNVRTYLKNMVENKEILLKIGRGKYNLYHPLFKEYLRGLK